MRAGLLCTGAILVLASCSLADLDGLSGGNYSNGTGAAFDAGREATTPDAHDAPAPDPAPDAGADASVCPGTNGPTMVRVGPPQASFCIDTTEVTVGQYRDFLAAKAGDTSGQSAVCAWNGSYVPGGTWPRPPTFDAYPIGAVDWCDAFAYCAWAGKRLCGQIGGGVVSPTDNRDPLYSQWSNACSSNGTLKYPYGGVYDEPKCNTNTGVAAPVASKMACASGSSGLFDMSGSVEEREDSCTANDADPTHATDSCATRGGSFNDGSSSSQYGCDAVNTTARNDQSFDIGFRCCGP